MKPHAAPDKPAAAGAPSEGAGGGVPDDRALVDRAKAGDLQARDELVRRHMSDVFNLTSRILSDRDLAQDATQDAFMNAVAALDRFRGESSFRTWLLRIATNAARTVARKQVRRREISIDHAENEAGAGADPAERAAMSAEAQRIEAMLVRLPPKQRMAVTLRIQQGLSYADIGAALECSEGAARVNYHLGIKRLREIAG